MILGMFEVLPTIDNFPSSAVETDIFDVVHEGTHPGRSLGRNVYPFETKKLCLSLHRFSCVKSSPQSFASASLGSSRPGTNTILVRAVYKYITVYR